MSALETPRATLPEPAKDIKHDAVRIAATIHAAAVALELDYAVSDAVPALAAAARS